MRQGLELIDSDLLDLEPREAVKFFRELLEITASSARLKADSHTNLNIFERDGGIDSESILPPDIAEFEQTGLIPQGRTGYQIKSTRLTEHQCAAELRNDAGDLKPYIQDIVAEEGNYVLVMFGQLTPQGRHDRIAAIRDEIEKENFDNFGVDLYSIAELVGYANRYPSLIQRYGPGDDVAVDIDRWSRRGEICTPATFVVTERREEIIQEIHRLLERSGDRFSSIEGAPIGRILGTSGLGKTRLLYEALKDEPFGKRVIYAKADEFVGSELAVRLESNDAWEAIMVIDDCSREQHRDLRNQYASYNRLGLVTISDDLRDVPAHLTETVHRLELDSIKEIIQSEFPDLPGHTIDRFARVSDGYPEMALLLAGQSIEGETEESILEISDSTIFDRLLVGDQSDAPDLNDLKRILTPFAFFNRIQWGAQQNEDTGERDWVSETFELDSEYSSNEIDRIVAYAKDRGILRGDQSLSLSTIPLASFLMTEQIQQNLTFLNRLVNEMPIRLQAGFAERIPYLNTLDIAIQWSSQMLRGTDWFVATGFHGNRGWIFRGLTEISPGEALIVLEEFLLPKEIDELEAIKDRRIIIESLRRIAVWEEYFFESAKLLQRLALAENDDQYVNNSTGTFADLFSAHYGPYSPTEVPPMERLPLLLDLLSSESSKEQQLGLEVIDQVLSLRGSRGGGIPHRQGAKPAPNFWTPDSATEVAEYLTAVWRGVERNLDQFSDEQFEKGIDVLLNNGRRMAKWEEVSPYVRETYWELLDQDCIESNRVLEATASIVQYDADEYPDKMRKAWVDFENEITYRSFHTRLNRFVGGRGLLDRSEDRQEIVENEIKSLAEETIQDPTLLRDELDWLLNASSDKAISFGRELGRLDPSGELIAHFVDGLYQIDSSASLGVFGAYLDEVVEDCTNAPHDVFNTLRGDELLMNFFPFLVRRADSSDKAAVMILETVERGDIPLSKIKQIESVARNGDLSEDVFMDIAEYLVEEDSGQAAGILVELAYDFYRRDDAPPIDEEIVVSALTHPELIQGDSAVEISGHWYDWEQLTQLIIEQNIDRGFEIGEEMILSFGERDGIAGVRENIDVVLRPLFDKRPTDAWDLVTKGFENQKSRIRLERWLSGSGVRDDDPAILSVPPAYLWGWVDQNPEDRAPQLARCVPAMNHPGWWDLTRELLTRYDDNEDVFSILSVLESGGRMGGEKMYRSRKEKLEHLRKKERNSHVRRWLTDEIRIFNDLFDFR